MKNTLIIISLFITSLFYAQGTFYAFNFTNYHIVGRLATNGQNCSNPYLIGSYEMTPNSQHVMNDYFESFPFLSQWTVRVNANSVPVQYNVNSPTSLPLVFNVFKNITKYNWTMFSTFDNGVNVGYFSMGYTNNNCSGNTVYDYYQGNNSVAFWFEANGATYLVIQ
jgi:hypothetical protein